MREENKEFKKFRIYNINNLYGNKGETAMLSIVDIYEWSRINKIDLPSEFLIAIHLGLNHHLMSNIEQH